MTKEFIGMHYKKDEVTLTNFIKAYIENCNTIVSDGWRAYQNLKSERYNHDFHENGLWIWTYFNFNYWIDLECFEKCYKKKTYRIIPSKNFVSYLREAEWKYLNLGKIYDEKIKEFFNCFKF